MRENVRLEFDKKLVAGDNASTAILVHEMEESCKGVADLLMFRFTDVKYGFDLSFVKRKSLLISLQEDEEYCI